MGASKRISFPENWRADRRFCETSPPHEGLLPPTESWPRVLELGHALGPAAYWLQTLVVRCEMNRMLRVAGLLVVVTCVATLAFTQDDRSPRRENAPLDGSPRERGPEGRGPDSRGPEGRGPGFGPPGPGPMGGDPASSLQLLRIPQVRAELAIGESQQEPLDQALAAGDARMREVWSDLNPFEFLFLDEETRQERMEEMQGRIGKANAEIDRKVNEILKPEQRERFAQLRRQRAGAFGLARPETAEALGLNEQQRRELRRLESATQPNPANGPPDFEQMRRQRKPPAATCWPC